MRKKNQYALVSIVYAAALLGSNARAEDEPVPSGNTTIATYKMDLSCGESRRIWISRHLCASSTTSIADIDARLRQLLTGHLITRSPIDGDSERDFAYHNHVVQGSTPNTCQNKDPVDILKTITPYLCSTQR